MPEKQPKIRLGIEKILGRLLDKLGQKWKRIAGLTAILILLILKATDVIDTETGDFWLEIAVVVFGVGVYHAQLKQENGSDA